MFLCALDYALGPTYEVVLAGNLKDSGLKDMLAALRRKFLPNKAVILVSGNDIGAIAPFTTDLCPIDGKATAYVCSDRVCQLPLTSVEKLIALLEKT